MVDFYMNPNPEDAESFYSNMVSCVKDYEAKLETQKYGYYWHSIMGPCQQMPQCTTKNLRSTVYRKYGWQCYFSLHNQRSGQTGDHLQSWGQETI